MKYNALNLGQIEAIVNKLGGIDGVQRLLNDETVLVDRKSRWEEKDGVIYFSVTSDGTTGAQWIRRLNERGIDVRSFADELLLSSDFVPTKGITTRVVVLKGDQFERNDQRSYDTLYADRVFSEATARNLIKTNMEVGCLIREMFSATDLRVMGLRSIIMMHNPVKREICEPGVLHLRDNSLLSGYCNDHRYTDGFAFAK